MNVNALRRKLGKSQVCRKVRSVPVPPLLLPLVAGAVHPFYGAKTPGGYGPKVQTTWAAWSATRPTRAANLKASAALPLRPGIR